MDFLKQSFRAVSFSVALTSNIWTSLHQRTCYLSVIAHYIDNEYKINKRAIGFRVIDESHSGEAIAALTLEVIQEYGIENRIISIALDNTSVMKTLKPYMQSYIGGYVLH